ncbi:MAG: hypothetical protein ACQCXQ_03730 [Verrucomicrobiales bacterium]
MTDSNTPSDKREFRCEHCNGKILIPHDLPPTTGPCPHCSKTITSPGPPQAPLGSFPSPKLSQPVLSQPAPTQPTPAQASPIPAAPSPLTPTTQVTPAAPQQAAKSTIPTPRPTGQAPAGNPLHSPAQPIPAAQSANPVQSPAPLANPDPKSTGPAKNEPTGPAKNEPKPAAKRIDIPQNSPQPANKRKSSQAGSKILPVLLVLLLLLAVTGSAIFFAFEDIKKLIMPGHADTIPSPNDSPNTALEANYLRIGWQDDAYQVLADYIAGTTVEEKLPHILNPEALASRMEDFYGGGVIIDSDTPASVFSPYELSLEDRKRGLFMMIYDQPPQFEMREFFRPLASLEVQYGLDEADILLSTLAKVDNFAMEPLRVHAFFKRTENGLKLDWEVFSQTKYRTLQSFVELPEVGQKETFRVFVVEDVPDPKELEIGTRTYRVSDPANITDTARVNVKVDSEPGRALSLINWRDTENSKPIVRTATIELEWTGDPADPTLRISNFVCWEFLGLGGQAAPSAASR